MYVILKKHENGTFSILNEQMHPDEEVAIRSAEEITKENTHNYVVAKLIVELSKSIVVEKKPL